MTHYQEKLRHGDRVFRDKTNGDREEAKVEQRISGRTKRPYLVVVFLNGPRKGQWEFPNRGGWQVDITYNPACDRPEYEDPSYSLKQQQAYSRIRDEQRAKAQTAAARVEPAPKHPPDCTCEECGPF